MCRTVIWYYEFWYDNILTLTGAMTAHCVLYCQARRWGEEWSLVHTAPTFKLIAAVKNCPVSHRLGRGQPGMGGQVRNKTPLSDDQQLTVAVRGLGITEGYSYSDDAENREGCTTAPGTTEQVSLLIRSVPLLASPSPSPSPAQCFLFYCEAQARVRLGLARDGP